MPIPIFIGGFGGNTGWKAHLIFLGLMGGILGVLVSILLSVILFPFTSLNPSWIGFWFGLGSSIGIYIAVNDTREEIKADWNKRIENPERYNLLTSLLIFGISNGIVLTILYFVLPIIEKSVITQTGIPIDYLPQEAQQQVQNILSTGHLIAITVIPVTINAFLLLKILFTNWQYRREMRLRAMEKKSPIT